MGFLNQLKSQAKALEQQQSARDQHLGAVTAQTEEACGLLLHYLQDLARSLSVIQPPGPALTVDGKTPWPAMKLADFRVDARRKMLRDREVIDYVAMGWRIVPQVGEPVTGAVSVNFPTDMRKVEDRLALGMVRHERREVRDAARDNVLQEVRYEYFTDTRGSVVATPHHDQGQIHFRLLNTEALEVAQVTIAVERIGHDLLDELAKRVLGQPNLFL
jgi:hypothetical protein